MGGVFARFLVQKPPPTYFLSTDNHWWWEWEWAWWYYDQAGPPTEE